jgi:hypothetical protein
METKQMTKTRWFCDCVSKCSLGELNPLLHEKINVELILAMRRGGMLSPYYTICVHRGSIPYLREEPSGEISCVKKCEFFRLLGYRVEADNDLAIPEIVALVFNEMVEEITKMNKLLQRIKIRREKRLQLSDSKSKKKVSKPSKKLGKPKKTLGKPKKKLPRYLRSQLEVPSLTD